MRPWGSSRGYRLSGATQRSLGSRSSNSLVVLYRLLLRGLFKTIMVLIIIIMAIIIIIIMAITTIIIIIL